MKRPTPQGEEETTPSRTGSDITVIEDGLFVHGFGREENIPLQTFKDTHGKLDTFNIFLSLF